MDMLCPGSRWRRRDEREQHPDQEIPQCLDLRLQKHNHVAMGLCSRTGWLERAYVTCH
jgi:hypothetical protein